MPRVVDLERKQVADLAALGVTHKGEELSWVYTNLLNGTWKPTQGQGVSKI